MKLDRYDGEVPIFSEDYEGRERTIFGSATESNDINDQFTPEFMRGWGIVGDTEFPTLQDFNALGFTHGKLISYLYQAGIPSYTANEKYYPGSIVQYNNDIYLCTATEPTSLPTDVRDWVKWQSSLGELAQIRADKNGFLLNKTGTYNALIDTDLVQVTGQSQTKIMTQKAVTDALNEYAPAGQISMWASSTLPTGYLFVRGQTFTAVQYPKLALLFPSLKLPDMRGVVARGFDDGRGFDQGRDLLSYQEDSIKQHIHQTRTRYYPQQQTSAPAAVTTEVRITGQQVGGEPVDVSVSTRESGISETRMKNISINFIIKAG